jgi:hypothetical protein
MYCVCIYVYRLYVCVFICMYGMYKRLVFVKCRVVCMSDEFLLSTGCISMYVQYLYVLSVLSVLSVSVCICLYLFVSVCIVCVVSMCMYVYELYVFGCLVCMVFMFHVYILVCIDTA